MKLDQLDLDEFAELIQLEKYAPKARCSQYLIYQLQKYLCNKPELNPSQVLAAIRELEGGKHSGTKAATKFARPPLKGLWHKHYDLLTLDSAAINIENAVSIEELLHSPNFDEETNPWTKVGKVADHIIEQGITQRKANKKYTGEWLIFVKHQGENYYLCLAKHDDADEETRAIIDERCVPEFPFLTQYLTQSKAT